MIAIMFSDDINKLIKRKQIEVGDYKTTHYSQDSYDFFKKIELESGYSEESLQELAMMEDQFLAYEKETVCGGISRLREAMTLDQQMKDRFQGWDFMHHQKHIQQMSQPNKLINKHLSC
jgi:hypothetical protein